MMILLSVNKFLLELLLLNQMTLQDRYGYEYSVSKLTGLYTCLNFHLLRCHQLA